jgi:hypothetical protein
MITIHNNIQQGTDEWLALRSGVLTASTAKRIVTPKTLKEATSDKARSLLYELVAQRITKHIDKTFVSEDMIRGTIEEVRARDYYEKKHGIKMQQVGFITNTKYGYTWGYSPDGLIGDDGLFETKSAKSAIQVRRIADNVLPEENMVQCQFGFIVAERQYLDYVSFSNGMKMMELRVYPDKVIQEAIINIAMKFEVKAAEIEQQYHLNSVEYIDTERVADVTDEIQIED